MVEPAADILSLFCLSLLQLGLNGLADLTHEEYKQKYALGMRKFVKKSNKLTGFSHGSVDADNLPAEIDWRKTAVAEVKNQQQVRRTLAQQASTAAAGAVAGDAALRCW